MNKADLNRAYSINRAINRLYYEKQRLLSGNYGHRVFRQKINELENELETFPLRLQLRVKEMLDSRDFNRDLYEGANWTKKWMQYQNIIKTNFTDSQILRFGTSIRLRQRNVKIVHSVNHEWEF
jgi:hypothetical protein